MLFSFRGKKTLNSGTAYFRQLLFYFGAHFETPLPAYII
jgi:hypothetical protein